MLRRIRLLGSALCLVISLAACGEDSEVSPLAPSPPPLVTGALTGDWTGTVRWATRETRVTVKLTEVIADDTRAGLYGTYSAEFPDHADLGTVSGARDGTSILLMLYPGSIAPCAERPPVPANTIFLTMNLSGSRFDGTALVAHCDGSTNGTATLEKQ